MEQALTGILKALETEEITPIESLGILSKEENVEILEVFNATELTYPSEKSVVELFEEQAKKTPSSAAITFEGTTLSYEELENRSNQLAHYLQAQGIETDTFVGICMDRSLELLVAILGVLKSGGAYVPVSYTHLTLPTIYSV